MNIHVTKAQENNNPRGTSEQTSKSRDNKSAVLFADNRPETFEFMKFARISNENPTSNQAVQLKAMAKNYVAQNLITVQKKKNTKFSFRENSTPSNKPVQLKKIVISAEGDEREEEDDYRLIHGEKLKFDQEKRSSLDKKLSDRNKPTPKVGISNRPGLGYDESVFTKGKENIEPTSLPHGFKGLDYVPKTNPGYERSLEIAESEKTKVQKARKPENAACDLSSLDGLFIPGGQDRDKIGSVEQTTRNDYEQSLVKEARSIGMPTLAVCGGSRAFAKAFGGKEANLSKAQQKIHKQGTDKQSHELKFPASNSILGDASPTKGTLDKINSTHEKVADLSSVNMLPPSSKGLRASEPELRVTATDENNNIEGFETSYGAPMVGVTSHPEAIYRGSGDRDAATPDAQKWSDNIFKGYAQSMETYSNKKAVNAEIRSKSKPEGYDKIGESTDTQKLHKEGFSMSKLGKSKADKNRQEKPEVYAKWKGKRNWQKLLELRMITLEEAEEMRKQVLKSKEIKKQNFLSGNRDRERPERY